MMTGTVNASLEATLALIVLGEGGQQRVETVIDTGFSGFLTLSSALITGLGLEWLGREQGELADGSVGLFDVFRGAVVWDGQPRTVEVEAVEAAPLLGMALLAGHNLHVRVVTGGTVIVTPLA